MTFHESTVRKLRGALSGHLDHLAVAEQAVEMRRHALALAQEELGYAEDRAAVLRANVADCQRWLDFAALCDSNVELAHAFANALLDRDGTPPAAGRAAEAPVPGSAEAAVARHPSTCTECGAGREADEAELDAMQEAWIEQYGRAMAEVLDAREAEARDDAWSTAEQIEHDQACEFAQDAADQERWAAEAAAESEAV